MPKMSSTQVAKEMQKIVAFINRGNVPDFKMKELVLLIGSYIEYDFWKSYGRYGRVHINERVKVSSDFSRLWGKMPDTICEDIIDALELLNK